MSELQWNKPETASDWTEGGSKDPDRPKRKCLGEKDWAPYNALMIELRQDGATSKEIHKRLNEMGFMVRSVDHRLIKICPMYNTPKAAAKSLMGIGQGSGVKRSTRPKKKTVKPDDGVDETMQEGSPEPEELEAAPNADSGNTRK